MPKEPTKEQEEQSNSSASSTINKLIPVTPERTPPVTPVKQNTSPSRSPSQDQDQDQGEQEKSEKQYKSRGDTQKGVSIPFYLDEHLNIYLGPGSKPKVRGGVSLILTEISAEDEETIIKTNSKKRVMFCHKTWEYEQKEGESEGQIYCLCSLLFDKKIRLFFFTQMNYNARNEIKKVFSIEDFLTKTAGEPRQREDVFLYTTNVLTAFYKILKNERDLNERIRTIRCLTEHPENDPENKFCESCKNIVASKLGERMEETYDEIQQQLPLQTDSQTDLKEEVDKLKKELSNSNWFTAAACIAVWLLTSFAFLSLTSYCKSYHSLFGLRKEDEEDESSY